MNHRSAVFVSTVVCRVILSSAILCPTPLAAQFFKVSAEPELADTILAAAKADEVKGNFAAAAREYKKMLELYPNEPGLQAPIFMLMSVDTERAGNPQQAQIFSSVSRTLDPALAEKAANSVPKGAVTRGGNDKADTILAIAQAALAGYAAIRAARTQSQPQPQTQQAGYNYPQAPYGQAGYQAPAGNVYSPTAGYADSNAQRAQYAQPQSQYGQPQSQYPQQQTNYPAPQAGYPQSQYPQQQQQPQYAQPQPYAQQPVQPAPPQSGSYTQPQNAASGQPQQGTDYYPVPQPAPYSAPASYQPAGQTRGDNTPAVKVIYDRSRIAAKDFFSDACGALLTTDGANLIFTPGCGEAPRVIPASDILEIRMNTTIGKTIGAFHIITKKGLYLDLAPASGDRQDGRIYVDDVRNKLGIGM